MKGFFSLYGLLALACLSAVGGASASFPVKDGSVTDVVGVLTPQATTQIQKTALQLRQTTGAEIAVAVVPTLEGLSVEEYAHLLFKKWGVGQKGKDNGVLILAAIEDRRMRIEVGYGLESQLPDGLCGDIIRQNVRPAFKEGNYSGGLSSAVERIAAILQGRESWVEAGTKVDDHEDSMDGLPLWAVLPFFGVFVGVGAFMLGGGMASKAKFPVFFGLFFGGIPLLISLAFLGAMTIPRGWLLFLPAAGVSLAVWAFRKVRRSPKVREYFRGAASDTDGWVSGGSSGGGSDSGSSSGGGSSGGGGASGSW